MGLKELKEKLEDYKQEILIIEEHIIYLKEFRESLEKKLLNEKFQQAPQKDYVDETIKLINIRHKIIKLS